jgi:hypothetical protein
MDAKRMAGDEPLGADREDERRWDAAFTRSAEALAELAAEALEEHRAGRTLPLDPERM